MIEREKRRIEYGWEGYADAAIHHRNDMHDLEATRYLLCDGMGIATVVPHSCFSYMDSLHSYERRGGRMV